MSDKDSNTIVVICGDPGGANAIVPVARKIQSDGIGILQVFAYRQACQIMEKNGIAFSVLGDQIPIASLDKMITELHPMIIITATSFNTVNHEKKLIDIARKRKIPCLSILDFWSNYFIRFSDDFGNLCHIPDKIAVMDRNAVDEMTAEGFPREVLVITGQPAFDTLADDHASFNPERRYEIKAELFIPANALVVAFMSQPLEELFGANEINPSFLGFTEKSVLLYLIAALEQISQECHREIFLLIRPHPREEECKFEGIHSRYITICIAKESTSREIMMTSDLVVGMNSEILVEACYLGCIVASLQPSLMVKDCLPTNSYGYSVPVYSSDKIFESIQNLLLNRDIRSDIQRRLKKLKPDSNATKNVVDVILHMIRHTNN